MRFQHDFGWFAVAFKRGSSGDDFSPLLLVS